MATGSFDLTNTVPAKMAALGISNVELAARYARLSPTTLRRVLSGTPGTAEALKTFDEILRDLAVLKERCWPCPLDFREVGEIRNLEHRLKNESTTIVNTDAVTAAGFDVLAGHSKVAEIPD